MRVPDPARPWRRTAVVGALGLLVGVLGGWVAGLLRAPTTSVTAPVVRPRRVS